jgi:hypothetical protein
MRAWVALVVLCLSCGDEPKTPADRQKAREESEALQRAARDLNDAQFGDGRRGRSCWSDRDCERDESCVTSGRSGVCAQKN